MKQSYIKQQPPFTFLLLLETLVLGGLLLYVWAIWLTTSRRYTAIVMIIIFHRIYLAIAVIDV